MIPSFDFKSDLSRAAASPLSLSSEERPLIAITGNWEDRVVRLLETYSDSVEAGGAIPVLVPPTDHIPTLKALLERVDGLLLSGGGDLNPLFLGEEPLPALGSINAKRDRCELMLTRLAYEHQMPFFGICRGLQVLVAALGGKLIQDLPTHMAGKPLLKHSQESARGIATHTVTTEEGSLVRRLLGERIAVNSFHHQAALTPGKLLKVTAYAPDGVVEAVESTEEKPVFAVQWHPESFLMEHDESQLPLFRHFTREAMAYRRARQLHARIVTLDSHCDTPMLFNTCNVNLARRNEQSCCDFHKMREGGLDAVVMAAYIPQGERTEEEGRAATKKADDIIAEVKRQVAACPAVGLATAPDDITRLKQEGRLAVLLGIENGYALGHDLANIDRYKIEGVAYITLCHNGDNDLCDSAKRTNCEHGGLSPLGREAVRRMNQAGMMVDLSHASEQTFYNVLEETALPVLCSHSNARRLCDSPRNLTDNQLKALAQNGGTVQVTFYPGFLRQEGEASIRDVAAHIMYLVSLIGVNHVGIGSDFDGDGGVRGLRSTSEMISLTRLLQAEGLTDKDLQMLWGGNFLRVFAAQR